MQSTKLHSSRGRCPWRGVGVAAHSDSEVQQPPSPPSPPAAQSSGNHSLPPALFSKEGPQLTQSCSTPGNAPVLGSSKAAAHFQDSLSPPSPSPDVLQGSLGLLPHPCLPPAASSKGLQLGPPCSKTPDLESCSGSSTPLGKARAS